MMKSTTLLAFPVILICLAATSAAPAPVAAVEAPAAAPTTAEPPPIPPLELPVDPDSGDPYVIHLAEYLAGDIIENWTPAVRQVPAVPPGVVAWDVARAVVHEPQDPGHCATFTATDGRKRCLWDVPGWNSDHAKAVLLAAVGYWEGARYAADVDNGNCNRIDWRQDPANATLIHIMGNCDGGRAHSLWQIWPRVGPAHDSPINASCDKDAVAVRYTAARCALQILRMSMMATKDLTGYTGETAPSWKEDAIRPLDTTEGSWKQKATVRLEFARKALKKHPFK
jgi:hypothetical protein